MTYELALKLKEAGFPQEPSGEVNELFGDTRHSDYIVWKEDACSPTVTAGTNDYLSGIERGDLLVKLPTLEELIKACGNWSMTHGEGMEAYRMKLVGGQIEKSRNWVAELADSSFGNYGVSGEGDTPSEAVANLWLMLKVKG